MRARGSPPQGGQDGQDGPGLLTVTLEEMPRLAHIVAGRLWHYHCTGPVTILGIELRLTWTPAIRSIRQLSLRRTLTPKNILVPILPVDGIEGMFSIDLNKVLKAFHKLALPKNEQAENEDDHPKNEIEKTNPENEP